MHKLVLKYINAWVISRVINAITSFQNMLIPKILVSKIFIASRIFICNSIADCELLFKTFQQFHSSWIGMILKIKCISYILIANLWWKFFRVDFVVNICFFSVHGWLRQRLGVRWRKQGSDCASDGILFWSGFVMGFVKNNS